MYSPLLNCFIVICKLMICLSVFIALSTHYWARDIDGKKTRGITLDCYNYGSSCHEWRYMRRGIWFIYIIILLIVTLELLNILLLFKRTRSRINLILEELAILTSIVFILPASCFGLFGIFMLANDYEEMDWSFKIFLLSLILALIDLICSLVRVVSYCRQNSFRSNVITYTSNQNHETVHIQS